MTRISPTTIENAPESTKSSLEAIKAGVGMVPNLLGTLGKSPAAINSYLNQKAAIKTGSLGDQVGESLAIAIASFSGCKYCASAHNAIGKNAGLSDEERVLNRRGESGDPKVQAAINLSRSIVETRGWSSDEAFESAKAGGLSEAEILEVLTITMFNLYTNYTNHFIETVIDFPEVEIDEAVAV